MKERKYAQSKKKMNIIEKYDIYVFFFMSIFCLESEMKTTFELTIKTSQSDTNDNEAIADDTKVHAAEKVSDDDGSSFNSKSSIDQITSSTISCTNDNLFTANDNGGEKVFSTIK